MLSLAMNAVEAKMKMQEYCRAEVMHIVVLMLKHQISFRRRAK
jgi:hypothetical protein